MPCTNDDQCSDSEVCSYSASCTAERVCTFLCQMDLNCGAGFTCEVATGVCNPLACPDEYECPDNFDCDPSLAAAGMPGCVQRTCTENAECDGFCVGGRCYGAAGECSENPPP